MPEDRHRCYECGVTNERLYTDAEYAARCLRCVHRRRCRADAGLVDWEEKDI